MADTNVEITAQAAVASMRDNIVEEAEAVKPLERYKNDDLKVMLDKCFIAYESDNNKKTLIDLLRNGTPAVEGLPVGVELTDLDLEDMEVEEVTFTITTEQAPAVEPVAQIFSHYEAKSRIKDNGRVFEAGDEYTGENGDRLMESGVLRSVFVDVPAAIATKVAGK